MPAAYGNVGPGQTSWKDERTDWPQGSKPSRGPRERAVCAGRCHRKHPQSLHAATHEWWTAGKEKQATLLIEW